MAAITVHAGDFPKGEGTVMFGFIGFPPGDGFIGQTISVTELETVEIATEESVKKVAGAVGWGVAGNVLLGPLGLLAGLLLGGRKTEVTFVAKFRDGRKFLGTAQKNVYKKMLAGTFSEFAATPMKEPTRLSAPTVPIRPEVQGDTKRKDLYEILEVSSSASKELIDAAFSVLSKPLSVLAETGNAEAQGKLTIINSVYEVLSDPRQKALYDERLARVQPTSTARPVVAVEAKAPSDCPKCGSINWKPASAVYKLFGLPESRRPTSSSGESGDDAPRGQYVSATERLRLYKAAAPPNSFTRTGALLAGAIVSAPVGYFFGPQWFLLFAMLGIAAVVAYRQDATWNEAARRRWKALLICMQCGHVYTPPATDLNGVQREKHLARMRDAEKDANARKWKNFGGVTIVVFAILAVSSIMWPQDSKTGAVTSASTSASRSTLGSNAPVKCDKAAAYDIQDKIKELAAVEETTGGVRYTIYPNSWATVRPKLDEFVHAIANVDACIEGKPRRIDILSPFGAVGFADPSVGVRVFP